MAGCRRTGPLACPLFGPMTGLGMAGLQVVVGCNGYDCDIAGSDLGGVGCEGVAGLAGAGPLAGPSVGLGKVGLQVVAGCYGYGGEIAGLGIGGVGWEGVSGLDFGLVTGFQVLAEWSVRCHQVRVLRGGQEDWHQRTTL